MINSIYRNISNGVSALLDTVKSGFISSSGKVWHTIRSLTNASFPMPTMVKQAAIHLRTWCGLAQIPPTAIPHDKIATVENNSEEEPSPRLFNPSAQLAVEIELGNVTSKFYAVRNSMIDTIDLQREWATIEDRIEHIEHQIALIRAAPDLDALREKQRNAEVQLATISATIQQAQNDQAIDDHYFQLIGKQMDASAELEEMNKQLNTVQDTQLDKQFAQLADAIAQIDLQLDTIRNTPTLDQLTEKRNQAQSRLDTISAELQHALDTQDIGSAYYFRLIGQQIDAEMTLNKINEQLRAIGKA